MSEPISREEHAIVENRLGKTEAEVAAVLSIAKSNADSISRLDATLDRGLNGLYAKIDQINSRGMINPATVISVVMLALLLLGGLLAFVSQLQRPTDLMLRLHQQSIEVSVEQRKIDKYNEGFRDAEIQNLKERFKPPMEIPAR